MNNAYCMHVQVLITFLLVSHCEQKISIYTYFVLRASLVASLVASFAFSKRPAVSFASGLIDFMLVQPNVLQQDGRIPAPLNVISNAPRH